MLGLSASLSKAATQVIVGNLRYLRDNLKLYMPFKTASVVKFVGTGSTSFDGGNDYIDTGSTFQTTFRDSFSIAYWMKPTDGQPSAAEIIMGVANASAEDYIYIYHKNDGKQSLAFSANNDADSGTTSAVVFTDGAQEWAHIVWTVEKNTSGGMKFYKNGALVESFDTTAITTGNWEAYTSDRNLFIGAYHNTSDASQEWFEGNMKNVGIWDRVLSQTEIQNVMYKRYDQLSGTETQGLVSWWALDATNLGSELITNGDMELNSNWTTSGGINTAQSTTQKHGGTYSWTFEANSSYDGIRGDAYTTVTGAVYQYSVWVYPDDGTDIQVKRRNGTNSGDVTLSTTALTQDQWNNITGTYTETAGGAGAYLHINSNNATSGVYYVDDVSVKEIQLEDLQGSNEGTNVGATIDTDIYGGDTPKIPRAVDNAPTARADTIGNGSASFDTTDDYLIMGDSADWDFGTGSWSVTFWAKITEDADQFLIGRWAAIDSANTARHWGIYFSNGNNDFTYVPDGTGGESGGVEASGSTNVFNRWAHAAYTRTSGGKGRLYVDGVLEVTTGSNDTQNHSNTDPIFIGNGQNIFASCNMAQVGIWRGALSQAAIQEVKEKSFNELSASDKSTLGAELQDTTWSNSDIVTFSDASATGFTAVNTGAGVGGDDNAYGKSITTEAGATYKYSFTLNITSVTTGVAWSFDSATSGQGTSSTGVITYADIGVTNVTEYVHTSSGVTRYPTFRVRASGVYEFTVSNFSIKKVTHDLVSYWSLDETIESPGTSFVLDKMDETTTQMMTNSDFTDDITGWGSTSNCSIAYSSGSLRQTSSSATHSLWHPSSGGFTTTTSAVRIQAKCTVISGTQTPRFELRDSNVDWITNTGTTVGAITTFDFYVAGLYAEADFHMQLRGSNSGVADWDYVRVTKYNGNTGELV